ncbi:MAG: DUF2293 domain-containing protein [Actinomycetota bacterium]|nr:DUF2293 domain-containing protein [Actinomycetota bacterium]
MVDDDPTGLHLEVYDTKSGLWHPELGDLVQPDGWELLPAGDAFLTRQVKAAGDHWVVFRPKGRGQHRRQLGVLAPVEAIAAAREAAAATASRRETQRESSSRQRERAETAYRAEFEDAVRQWLAFAPKHQVLADEIARGAADRAAVVGSGRVGRTKMLTLDERAALAARAFIRHRHTDYEDRLFSLELGEVDLESAVGIYDVGDYREIKRSAHREVDAFLEHHRVQ